MPERLDKKALLARLVAHFTQYGLVRVHPDATEPVARAALLALAGLPQYEQIWVGDLHPGAQLVLVASGERLPGVEFARRVELVAQRAEALRARVKGPVQALQLALYDRQVPTQELDFVLSRAQRGGLLPFARDKVATWVFAMAEPALHANKFRGWAQELSAPELCKLLD